MKKQYSKPCIIIEDFKITETISSGCSATSNVNFSRGSCGWDLNDGLNIIWVSEATKCYNQLVPEDIVYDGLCYNNPEGVTTVFSS